MLIKRAVWTFVILLTIGISLFIFNRLTDNERIFEPETAIDGDESERIYMRSFSGEEYVLVDLKNSNDFSFASWIYWNGGEKDQRVFEIGEDNNNCMYFSPFEGVDEETGFARFYIGKNGTGEMLTTANPLPDNEWVHVGITLKNGLGRLYINGKLVDSRHEMKLNLNSFEINKAYIGQGIDKKTKNFKGILDNVVMINEALTEEEIEMLSKPLICKERFDDKAELSDCDLFEYSRMEDGNKANANFEILNGEVYLFTENMSDMKRDFTIMSSIKVNKSEESQALFSMGGPNYLKGLVIDHNGQLSLVEKKMDQWTQVQSDQHMQFDEWMELFIVIVNKKIYVYIDGMLLDLTFDNDISSELIEENLRINIGHMPTYNNLTGMINELKVIGAGLNQKDIYQMHLKQMGNYIMNGNVVNDLNKDEEITVKGRLSYEGGYQKESQSAFFPEGNGYLSISNELFRNENLTFMAWIKTRSDDKVTSNLHEQSILDLRGKKNTEFNMKFDSEQSKIDISMSFEGKSEELMSTVVPSDKWVHIALVVSKNEYRLYVDGVMKSSVKKTIVDDYMSSIEEVTLLDHFTGYIQDIQIYHNDLRVDDICRAMRNIIKFPDVNLNLEYIKPNDMTISKSYDYWDYAQEHDGEIVKDDKTGYYYIYSTDTSPGNKTLNSAPLRPAIQIRRSRDLIHWEFIGWVWEEVPSDAVEWTDTDSMLWAPSVNYFGGKWYLYYAVSSLGNRQTYLGVATSDSPAGPWVDRGMVFKTEENDEKYDVNPIDPNILIDKNGKPWLTYGSYYGGIYINELDPSTGKFINYGEGTCIARRRDNIDVSEKDSIEGPFIVYHEPSDKYVLFVSYDHFYGNYNLRVGRSDEPNGNYYDYNGNSLKDVKLQQKEEVGTKIIGSYQFNNHPGWIGLGHNAIFEENGTWISLNNSHSVADPSFCYMQIRKLIWTDEGWPILSPQMYAKEEEQLIPPMSVVGNWEKIKFRQKSNEMLQSKLITLNADGTIGNSNSNTWEFVGGNKMKLSWYYESTNELLVEEVYVLPAWDWENWKPTLIFTGFDKKGMLVWGKNVDK